MTAIRPTASSITDAELDQLYEERRQARASLAGTAARLRQVSAERDQLRAELADAAAPTTCDTSIPGVFGQPLGPCILRHGHDGPVHKAANGATWWPRAQPTGIISTDSILTPAQAEALRAAFPGARIDAEIVIDGTTYRYQRTATED